MHTLRSLFIWVTVILTTLLVFFPILICSTVLLPFNPQKTWAHRMGILWALFIFKMSSNWKVTVKGREYLPKGPAVFISNHESMADIIALYLLQCDFKWLAKKELFKVPFFGWSMAFSGYIPLERGSIRSTAQSLDKARDYLKKGVSILIFPEGTRSEDGELREFKGGAFKLAVEERVPLVPVAITGTRHILQKGSWLLANEVRVSIQVLPPIATTGLTGEDEKELRTATRDKIKNGLREIRKSASSPNP